MIFKPRLTWDEIDETGGVIRLSPARSKTLVGRILPISPPIADALDRRQARSGLPPQRISDQTARENSPALFSNFQKRRVQIYDVLTSYERATRYYGGQP